MENGPDDLVVRIPREIQGTLSEHTQRFDHMDASLTQIGRRLDDVHQGMITSLGLAGHAHVRQDGVQKELDELKQRIERLEERL